MAEEPKRPSLPLGGNNIVLVIAVVFGTLFVAHDRPLTDSRPAVPEIPTIADDTAQDLPARLWQDPFEVVSAALSRVDQVKALELTPLDKVQNAYLASPIDRESLAGDIASGGAATSAQMKILNDPHKTNLVDQLAEDKRKDARVLVVMMPGSSYEEDVEVRRRVRYAVLAGLDVRGYYPEDSEHLGYYMPSGPPAAPDSALPEMIPFEWLKKDDPDGEQSKYAVVIWLDESIVRSNITGSLVQLKIDLIKNSQKINLSILGPFSSETLASLAEKIRPDGDRTEGRFKTEYKSVPFLVYSASASDEMMLRYVDNKDRGASLEKYFQTNGISLTRSLADDKILARDMVGELARRGVDTSGKDRIVLVSELDTDYGRAWRDTFGQFFDQAKCADNPANRSMRQTSQCRIQSYTYLRGLDGQLPGQRSTGASRESGAGKQAVGGDQGIAGSAAKPVERAEGQSQYDYLRRIEDRIREDEGQRNDPVRAVGVLGNDVYDKLLILRALRPKFPRALFFTTDLDAVLLQRDQLDVTHNLIVASSFGLELAEPLQQPIPPFRGTYQTAAFLATQMALAPAGSIHGEGWFSQARLFEIGRSRLQYLQNRETAGGVCGELRGCQFIHSHPKDPYRIFQFSWHVYIFTMFVTILILGLLIWISWRSVPDNSAAGKNRWIEPAIIGAMLVVTTVAAALRRPIIDWLTGRGLMESTDLDGVGSWPTVLLRVLTIVVAILLMSRGMIMSQVSINSISKKFCFKDANGDKKGMSAIIRRMRCDLHDIGMRRLIYEAFFFSSRKTNRTLKGGSPTESEICVDSLWEGFLYQRQHLVRFIRVASVDLVLMLIWVLLSSLLPAELPPGRDGVFKSIYAAVESCFAIATFTLMALTIEQYFFGYIFLNRLALSHSNWPEDSKNEIRRSLGISRRNDLMEYCMEYWLDIKFTGARTKFTNNVVTYAFIVLSLIWVCTTPVFSVYSQNTPILITGAIAAFVTTILALRMRRAAEKSRSMAITRLEEVRIGAMRTDETAERQIGVILEWIRNCREGAFMPLQQQPVLVGLIFPIASTAGTVLAPYLLGGGG